MSDIGGAKRTAEDGIDGEAELHAAKRKREQDAEEQENSDVSAQRAQTKQGVYSCVR